MFRRLLIILVALLPVVIHAQVPSVGTTIEEEFKATTVPEKWKEESAVIIGQKTEYLFTRVSGSRNAAIVRINEYVHKRIKLQDKNSLEEFSTFYYVTMGKDGKADYRIIKANGKEIPVDMKTAIEEEKDVPSIYRPIFMKMNIKSMKIAIPNLEIGDIIDYTVQSTIDWNMREEGIEFSPFIFSIANNYPTMYQQYRFTMANGMKVKFRAFNGAPNIRYDAKASVRGENQSFISYYFIDKDREKTIDERWSLEYRNLPTVKFRVILYSDNDESSKGLGEATVDRKGLDMNNVYRRYAGAAAYVTPTVNSLVGYTTEYMLKKRNDGTIKTNDEIIRETYYCMRKVFLEIYYKGPVHSDLEKYMTGKKLYKKILAAEKKEQKEEREDEIRINSVTFVTALRMALGAMGIESELFVYVPRKYGGWRDAIFTEELDFMLRVKYKKKFHYVDAFNNFDAFAQFYPYMASAEGYAINYQTENSYFRANIPATNPADHVEKQEFKLALNSGMDIINAERISSYLGAEKIGVIGKANITRDYLANDFEKYFNVPKNKKKDDIALETSVKYENPDREEKEKERKELFEKDLKAVYDVDKYLEFDLIEDGRYGDTAWLKFSEKFSLKKLVNRAGKNYVIEIGKIIGSQIKLEPKELAERKTDIWITNARTLQNNIKLAIPAGYSVEGIEELNMNIENESGAFISTAKIEGEDLVVTTTKIYKKDSDKKESWPNYIAFLEGAYKFSQAKIVLKKK